MDEQEKKEFEKLKEEIDQIRSEYSSAKKILNNISSFGDTFQTLRTLLNDEGNGVQANYNLTKTKKEQIESLFTQAETHVNDISSNLQKVKGNIESMQTAYSEFSEIKGKVSGTASEIETLLTTARGLRDDITTTKKDALDTLEQIKTTYQSVSGNIKDMQDAYQEFLQIQSKIDDKKTGLQAIFEIVQTLNKQSSALHTEIVSFRDNSKTFLSEIEQNKKQTDKLKSDIENNYSYTEQKKSDIEKATGLIIDTSFAETFKLRQNEIERGLSSWYSWKNIFLAAVFILIILVVLPFTPLLNFGVRPWYELFLSRLFYTSPALFLIAFSAIQYSREKDLAEKYAFKAASSSAIRSHVDYLIDKFGKDAEGSVLHFATETFETIYKEPHASEADLKKRVSELEKKLNEAGTSKLDVGEIVKNVKELKELLPEKGVFEKVVSIFVK